jgi:hypothetical protein
MKNSQKQSNAESENGRIMLIVKYGAGGRNAGVFVLTMGLFYSILSDYSSGICAYTVNIRHPHEHWCKRRPRLRHGGSRYRL